MVSLSIPRWFIVGPHVGGELRGAALRLLELSRSLFIPFAVHCRLVGGRIECSDFSQLERHIALTEVAFNHYPSSIKHIVVHTEYQVPLWPVRQFIERYSCQAWCRVH